MKTKIILVLSAAGLLAGCGMNPYRGNSNTDDLHNINNVSGIMPSKGNPSKL